MKQPTSPPCPVCGNRHAEKVSEKPGSGIQVKKSAVKQVYRCRCGNAFTHVKEQVAGSNSSRPLRTPCARLGSRTADRSSTVSPRRPVATIDWGVRLARGSGEQLVSIVRPLRAL